MKLIRAKRWAIGLLSMILIGGIFLLPFRKTSHISKALGEMSAQEHYCLGSFLVSILFSNSFSYLLFGSKPIAAAWFEKKTDSFHFSRYWMCEMDFIDLQGLAVFKKYRHLFSSKNIIVRFDETEEDCFLLMINKKNLAKVLEENISDFKKVLGPDVTKESLFAQITTGENQLVDVVKGHDALFGILLGYGRSNAWLFHERSTLRERLQAFNPPQKTESHLKEVCERLTQKLGSFSEEEREYKYYLKSPRIPLPHFVADAQSEETKHLKEKYGQERENMRRIFAKNGHVEASLQVLMDK